MLATQGSQPLANSHLDFETPLGTMRAISDGKSLIGLDFWGSKNLTLASPEQAADQEIPAILAITKAQVLEYFAGERKEFTIPLDPPGTETQKRIWSALLDIPYGQTITYGKQAERLGMENGQRAVGMINGQNPIAIIVPCHRVIASTGKLQGYAGGLEKKRFLLDLEQGPNLFGLG